MQESPSPIIWFEISVRDLEVAEPFYRTLLGWSFRPFDEYDPVNYHIVSTAEGTLGGALIRRPADQSRGATAPGTTVYAQAMTWMRQFALQSS
jgi:predicted enzyme related to lactoylglutathione lyase